MTNSEIEAIRKLAKMAVRMSVPRENFQRAMQIICDRKPDWRMAVGLFDAISAKARPRAERPHAR